MAGRTGSIGADFGWAAFRPSGFVPAMAAPTFAGGRASCPVGCEAAAGELPAGLGGCFAPPAWSSFEDPPQAERKKAKAQATIDLLLITVTPLFYGSSGSWSPQSPAQSRSPECFTSVKVTSKAAQLQDRLGRFTVFNCLNLCPHGPRLFIIKGSQLTGNFIHWNQPGIET